jgi:hypothetical protein
MHLTDTSVPSGDAAFERRQTSMFRNLRCANEAVVGESRRSRNKRLYNAVDQEPLVESKPVRMNQLPARRF